MTKTETTSAIPDIVIEGVRLAWRDGDDLIVRMPGNASRAQLKAVNAALGATRFRRQRCYLWLDGHHFSEEVRLQVTRPVAVAA